LLICFLGIPNLSAAENTAFVANFVATSVMKITVKPLAKLLLEDESSVTASVISLNQPILRAQITAKVKHIYVEIGDHIKQGEVLLSVDCREYNYALQQVQASYQARTVQINLLKKNYQRDKRLLQKSTISQTRFDQSEADYLSAQADIKALSAQQSLAQLQVERCQIKAPFSGKIIKRQVQKGQLVSNQTALFTLLQIDNLHISAKLTETEIVAIQQAEQINFRQHGENNFVKLYTIVPLANEKTRTQELRFSLLDQYKIHLVTGSAGRIIWQSSNQILPAAYISKRKNQLGIFVVKNIIAKNKKTVSKAVFIPLTHAQEGRDVKIDLPLDSLIIETGRLRVQDQQVVKIQ
jgi:RND family efflux transporter MFP subunit